MESVIKQPNIFSMSKLCFPSMLLTRIARYLGGGTCWAQLSPKWFLLLLHHQLFFHPSFGKAGGSSSQDRQIQRQPTPAWRGDIPLLPASLMGRSWHGSVGPARMTPELFPPKSAGVGSQGMKSACRCFPSAPSLDWEWWRSQEGT